MNDNHYKIIALHAIPFDKLRTNGINQSFLKIIAISFTHRYFYGIKSRQELFSFTTAKIKEND